MDITRRSLAAGEQKLGEPVLERSVGGSVVAFPG
jgi:hypothetical protein